MSSMLYVCLISTYFCYQEDIAAIFSKADKNKTGTLNVEDLKEVITDICERYPQVELHLKKKRLRNFVDLLSSGEDTKKQIDIERFKTALEQVDSQFKNLPATAQVNYQLLYILIYVHKLEVSILIFFNFINFFVWNI